jgi:hypothetical protein
MTAGLYLLAGPFQSDRSDLLHVLPLWGILTLYEFLVIGMITVLRRRGIDTAALTLVSLSFLADPVFFGDAFTSIGAASTLVLTSAAALVSILKAWALARACGYSTTPWRAGWIAAALILVNQIPNLNTATAIQPASVIPPLATCLLAGLAVPLWREGPLGRAAVAALGVHFLATGVVASLPFQLELLTGPLLAVSALLPWPRLGWIPLPAALYTSPLRPRLQNISSTAQGLGTLLVGVAFLLLGIGFWRSLKTAPVVETRPQQAA